MNRPDAAILEFDHVILTAGDAGESGLSDVDFKLCSGEFLLVLLDREHLHLPLADAASGLVKPVQGAVRFAGETWHELGADAAADRRGRIGRLFDEECWVSNLDLDENLTLAQRHHTRRTVAELREEAAALAHEFLLPGLPLGRPDRYRRQDLQKAACVRAFMGRPALILLERPTNDIYADVMSPLANAVYAARRRGAAVLWTTDERRVWDDAGLRPTRRALISAAQWHRCDAYGQAIPVPACQ